MIDNLLEKKKSQLIRNIFQFEISTRNVSNLSFRLIDLDRFLFFFLSLFSFCTWTRERVLRVRIIKRFAINWTAGGSLFRSTDGTESSKSLGSEFVGPQVDLT